MGGKRTRTRNLIYFCIVSLTILSLLSCIRLKEKETVQLKKDPLELKQESAQTDENLQSIIQTLSWAKILLDRHDFDGALRENQRALARSGKNPPGDDALYQMGLIYAHYGNSKKDYGKSLVFFKRVTTDYPKSALAEQARAWIGMLQENEKLNQTIQNLNRVIEQSKRVDIEIEEKRREKAK